MDIVVCFALFLAAMLFCLVKDFSLAWALLFALVLFFALGLRRGYGAKALVKMAWSKMPKSMIVLRILFFIGLLTGLWRSCGTIAFFIYHGIRVITPSLFILVAFLLTVLLSAMDRLGGLRAVPRWPRRSQLVFCLLHAPAVLQSLLRVHYHAVVDLPSAAGDLPVPVPVAEESRPCPELEWARAGLEKLG